jgi:hypothetical protein
LLTLWVIWGGSRPVPEKSPWLATFMFLIQCEYSLHSLLPGVYLSHFSQNPNAHAFEASFLYSTLDWKTMIGDCSCSIQPRDEAHLTLIHH